MTTSPAQPDPALDPHARGHGDTGSATPDTRRRLLEAAGEIFADMGFAGATIRDISARAGTNIAAINYHFRDKETLYAETLRYAHCYALEHYPHHGNLAAGAAPEARLRAFVRSFLEKTLDATRPTWHGRLISREMIEPTPALDMLVREGIRPQYAELCALVAELGPGLTEKQVQACAGSVIGQALHYFHCRALITRLFESGDAFPFSIDELTEHVTAFSLAAISGMSSSSRTGAALPASKAPVAHGSPRQRGRR